VNPPERDDGHKPIPQDETFPATLRKIAVTSCAESEEAPAQRAIGVLVELRGKLRWVL